MKQKNGVQADYFDSPAESYPRKRANVRVRVIDEETIVLDRRQGLIHQLNQTASFVWERCDGRCTLEEIATRLMEAFDVDFNTAVDDVRKVIEQLEERKLLEP
jgi:hypothetical protein